MCTAERETHEDRAQSACGQLMLSLEQPQFSHWSSPMAGRHRTGSHSNNLPLFTYLSLEHPVDVPERKDSVKHCKLVI